MPLLKISKKSALGLALIAYLSVDLAQPVFAHGDKISLQSITDDVTYLASDALNGRASFSKEIDQAADYIAKRFAQIGLSGSKGDSNFKQTFSILNINPVSLTVSLNGVSLDADNLTMASSMTSFSWQNEGAVQRHIIGKNDDMRAILGKLNQQGGQHFVLLHPDHHGIFKRYQSHFKRGLTKLNLNHQGAIVVALSPNVEINSLAVEGRTRITKNVLTNVVALLPGKTKPEEIVLYSAHYDHLDPNASGDDKIYNGADDDASGTTAVINLAEHFARQGNNARTLMFTAFSGEEIGGFGSRYFSQQVPAEQIVAMINIEMIGKPSKFGDGTLWMTGMERSNLGQLMNQQLKSDHIEIYKDPYPEQNLFYRSDNATLARLGVPAHSFSSTQLDKDKHYHQVTDDVNSLDLPSMHKVINSLAIASKGLVDASDTPSKIDTSKVIPDGLIY